ncbi:MAG: OmpA family protein [Flavobacteriales bacterium]|nr:OmpA family protein [Flavobacteriales bacterium]
MIRHLIVIAIIHSITINHFFSQEVIVRPLNCNGKFQDYAPIPYLNGLIFCSDRPSSYGIVWTDESDNFESQLYFFQDEKTQPFGHDINKRGNDGPVCFDPTFSTLYLTTAIRDDHLKPTEAQGIFMLQKMGDEWSEAIPFPFNAKDQTYNCGHPSLDATGQKLFFTSDLPGGFGGKDIYYSLLTTDGWSKPVNAGPEVNTEHNEIFPFMAKDGTLYYSSDRNNQYDIYKSDPLKGKFLRGEAMPSPVNSEFNDYAFSISENNEHGYFTSNRIGGQDDIYAYDLSYPDFENCPPAEEPSFCYLFEETEIVPNDSMPMIFEWELGDGATARGLSTEYCYKDFGNYHVALNVYDSLTKARFARVSEVDVSITKSPYPFITAPDSVSPNIPVFLSADGTDMSDVKAEKYFWNFGDGSHGSGFETSHPFKQSGKYTIQLGIIAFPPDGGEIRRCATHDIMVGAAEEIQQWVAEQEAIAQNEVSEPEISSLQEDMVIVEKDSTTYLQYAPDSTLYFIEFKESAERMKMDDPYFNNIKYEITERYDSAATAYRYSVGHTNEMPVMMRIYRDMVSNGYLESIIREQVSNDYEAQLINKWWYMPDSLESAFNAHLNKFSDIRFDFGTYNINPASFDNLDYIAEIMNLDHNIKLRIKAYTDSIGTDARNMQLAKKRADSVSKYLTDAGVDSKRLIAVGFGEAMPVAENASEEGRARNRRVEFEIITDESRRRK